jgi:UDP-glucose 4-epimerase
MTKVLVTGGAGFIGSQLVKGLVEKDYEVIVIDNLLRGNKIEKSILSKVNFIKEDVRNYDAVVSASKECDIIFHFAALLGVDIVADNPVETMETEVVGMKNVCDASMINKVEKIVYTSTSGVYGHSAIEKSVTENIQVDPRTSYSIAKRYCEIYLAAQYEQKGLQSLSLRLFNVYGPHQDTRMVIPRFIEQALKNSPISVYGNGKQTRDFTYVDDVVYATIELAENVKGCEIFNISNENEISINDLANLIKKVTNSSSGIMNIDAPAKRYDYEVERRVGNSDKLYKFIHYRPNTTLSEGLQKVVEYVSNRR